MNWISLLVGTVYAVAAFLIMPLLAIDAGEGNCEKKEVKIHNGAITLSGILTLPVSGAPYPCLVLHLDPSSRGILGAAEAFAPKYLNKMANDLARNGIATLWYEMRGADLSHKEYLEFTLEDFADDALAAVRFLEQRPEIDSSRIGLCGLSMGGGLAALTASRSKEVDFLVLLEAPGVSAEEADRIQSEAMGRARGATEEEIQEIQRGLKQIYRASRSGKVDEAFKADMHTQASETLKNLPEEQRPPVDQFVQAQLDRILSPNFRYLLELDVTAVFKKIQCPTLALFGEDYVVPAKEHRAAMKAAFEAGGNKSFTTRTVPRASHLFTDMGAGPREPIPSKIVFAPGFPDVIADWILKRK